MNPIGTLILPFDERAPASVLGWIMIALICVSAVLPMPAHAENASCHDRSVLIAQRMRSALDDQPLGTVISVYCEGRGRVFTLGTDGLNGAPLTEDTPLYIASVTKAFTGWMASLAHLDRRLPLDASIGEVLSAFDSPLIFFRDGEVGSASLFSLLSHTHEIDNGYVTHRLSLTGEYSPRELEWLLSEYTVRRPADHEGGYRYSNFGYNLYTELLEEATGRTWKTLMEDELLDPLGMSATRPFLRSGVAGGFRADADGGFIEIPLAKNDAALHSAGGLVSTGRDLLRFVEALANPDTIDKPELREALVEATRPRVSAVPVFGTHNRLGEYGLGFAIDQADGHEILISKGSFAGRSTFVSAVPDLGFGVAVHTNQAIHGNEFGQSLMATLTRCAIGGCDVDSAVNEFSASARPLIENVLAANERHAAALAERTWRLRLPKSSYCGTFHHSGYGTLKIGIDQEDRLELRTGPIRSTLQPYPNDDAARAELVPGRGQVLEFDRIAEGIHGLLFAGAYFARLNDSCR